MPYPIEVKIMVTRLIMPPAGLPNKGFRKNPAYGRQRISQPIRIVGLIQFWRSCVIYFKK